MQLATQAEEIAAEYGVALNQEAYPRLRASARGLVLELAGCAPMTVDFDAVLQRTLDKKHGLIRACKPQLDMHILDATAGWGRDAILLAKYGAKVTLVERQALMAALLADGLQRMQTPEVDVSLIHQDALDYLQQLTPNKYPDVIYIDPMHPVRQKSALVKKDMQALQQLFGADEDAEALIALALKRARKKVVVKWPQRLPPLIKPNGSIPGKTVRFDLYRTDAEPRSLR
ncbi:MAG: class I SAM-dependent methyltransferase [Gammaproteobacteria bacterium]|nr:class I SAM-dependent methyltransferase [Gammaproteobacteria bacterium]